MQKRFDFGTFGRDSIDLPFFLKWKFYRKIYVAGTGMCNVYSIDVFAFGFGKIFRQFEKKKNFR